MNINKAIRVVFFGSADFSIPSLDALKNGNFEIAAIITQPDKPTGRGKNISQNVVKRWAVENNLMVIQPEQINNEDFFQKIMALKADVFVVAAYGKLLPKTLLEIPELGAINLHGSLLPRYRGASPIQASILGGDTKTGACIMLMDEKMDTGALLAQKEVEILPTDTAGTLGEKVATLGSKLLTETIIKWFNKTIIPIPQSTQNASICKKISKRDGRIDWMEDSERIERKIRAFNPWPTAWTTANNGSVIIKIHNATIADSACINSKPGHLYIDDQKRVLVCCGDDRALRLNDIQPQNKNIMPAYDYILGHKDLLLNGLF